MIAKIAYYIFLIPISILPYWILYRISDLIYLLLYYVFGYRKKVVFENLRNSFPSYTQKEIKGLGKKFFKHFCDIIVESIKNFTISKNQISKRIKFSNPEILSEYFEQGKNVILVGGHYNNWEMPAIAVPVNNQHNHHVVGIYKPLSNPFFNKKITSSREKFGMRMVPMKMAKDEFNGQPHGPQMIILGGDQCPSDPKKAYWMNFLNQDTGVHFGAEKYAKEHNIPLIYVSIEKVKRGYYLVHYKLISDSPTTNYNYGELTELHTKELEKDIISSPQYWLWTHKRWKRKRPNA